MFSFLYAMTLLQDGQASSGSSAWVYILFVVAILFIVLFLFIEHKSPEPIIPLTLFRSRIISMANLDSFILCVITVAAIFYLPLWIQGVYGKSATYSGLAMIPFSIAWPIGSIIAGHWISRKGLRFISTVGACCLLASSIGFTYLNVETPIYIFLVFSFMAGFSYGISLTTLTIAVTSAVGKDLRGAAVASNNFIRTLGQMIGITVFGLMLHTGQANQIEADVLEGSLHTIFIWVTVLSVLAAVVSFAMPKLETKEEQQDAS